MRAIFCGNFEYDARQSELERLFRRYGKVDRVDMKSGFAFVYMEDERDAEDAIRALDRIEFGRKGRRLRVEWTKQEHGSRKPAEGGRGGGGGSRRSSSDLKPSKTLFVINFDPQETRTKDLERHFEPYGKIASVRIRRNFAFVQYEHLEDATEALHATNKTDLLDRVISVEYAVRDDDERRDGNGSDRGGDRYRSSPPDRRRGRSPTSPYRRERGSPDYGRGGSRGSPDYGRGGGNRRKEERVTPPDYAPPRRGGSSPSPPPPPPLPPPHKRGERPSSDVRRERRSRSPYGGGAPENGGRDQSPLPYDRKRPRRGNRSQSPYDDEEEERDNGRRRRVTKDSPAAAAEDNKPYSPDNGAEPTIGGGADSPANGRDHSISPAQED